MDPIAKFLNIFYCLGKNRSIIDIFNDGVTFLEFICQILGIPLRYKYLIPEYNYKPDDKYITSFNNLRALKFLTMNYPGIIDITKPYETEEDICELFKTIITKVIFNIDTTKIFNICKRLFSKYQITIEKEEDLLNKETFMTLLYLLYYHKNPKDGEINIQNFDNFIHKITFTKKQLMFEQDNAKSCKPFIDSSFFDKKYNFFVYIQIHAIFIFLGYEFYDPIILYLCKTIGLSSTNKISSEQTVYSIFSRKDNLKVIVNRTQMINQKELPQSFDYMTNNKEKNLIILQILHSFYPSVFPIDQSIETEEDRFDVLKTIINFCFNYYEYDKNFINCHSILSDYGITIKNMNDLFTPQNVMNLFYILAYRELPKFEVTLENFDELIEKIRFHFEMLLPEKIINGFFITSDFFNEKYNFLIHIQITNIMEILFDDYHKINPVIYVIYRFYDFQFFNKNIISIKSFFNNGYHFPRFVSLVANGSNDIPGVLNVIKNEEDVKHNNLMAFQFLREKFPDIISIQSIENPQDQFEILKIILTKIMFNIDENKIRNKCKYFLDERKKHFPNSMEIPEIDFSSQTHIVELFCAIFRINEESSNDFDEFIDKIARMNGVNLFINEDFIYKRYEFLIQIQLHLIFRFFGNKKTNQLIKFIRNTIMPNEICPYLIVNVDSFFNDGYFRVFVKKVLKQNYEIPGILVDVKNKFDIQRNNRIALKYLINKYPKIIVDKSYDTTQERFELLKKIIIEIYYRIDPNKLYDKINQYFVQFNDQNCKNDQLINYLSVYQFMIHHFRLNGNKLNQMNNDEFDKFINEVNVKCRANVFINSSFFDEKHIFLVYLQIFILLDSDRLNRITAEIKSTNLNSYGMQFKFGGNNNSSGISSNWFMKSNNKHGNNNSFSSQNQFGNKSNQFGSGSSNNAFGSQSIQFGSGSSNNAFGNKSNQFGSGSSNSAFGSQSIQFGNGSSNNGFSSQSQFGGKSNQFSGSFKTFGSKNQLNYKDDVFVNKPISRNVPGNFLNIHKGKYNYNQPCEYQCFLTRDPHYYFNSSSISLNQIKSYVYNSDSPETRQKLFSYKPKISTIIIYSSDDDFDGSDDELPINSGYDFDIDDKQENDSNENIKEKMKSFQYANKKALLKTINILGSKSKLYFKNLSETVQKNSISKFVVSVLGLQNEGYLSSDFKVIEFSHSSNEDVIAYLKNKDAKFGTLVLDFTNEQFAEPSAILFYTSFLNIYFLKETRRKLYERCLSILNFMPLEDKIQKSIKSNMKKEFKLLTSSLTFNVLMNFINKIYEIKCFNEKAKKNKKDGKEKETFNYQYQHHINSKIYKRLKIPQLFDKKFLKDCSSQHKIPDVIYYRLQFYFNAFDSIQSNKFIQLLISDCAEFKRIKVPSYIDLVKSVKSKVSSLKITKSKVHKNESKGSFFPTRPYVPWDDPDYLKEMEELKKTSATHFLPFLKTANYSIFSEFNLRLSKNYAIPIYKSIEAKGDCKSTEIESSEKYWNSIDYKLEIDDDCFYFNKLTEDNWNTNLFVIQNEAKNSKSSKKKSKKISDEKKDKKEKIYKFFVYNDKKEKWKFNDDVFVQFADSKDISNNKIKTPLVLFVKSSENDSNLIVSKLINHKLPDLDDDEIYVYGFCDKDLEQFDFLDDKNSKKQPSQIKPIFLLLHVPTSRENEPKTEKIILQIYSFLSYISDVKISILNKKYYRDQVETIFKMNNLYSKKRIEETLNFKSNSFFKSLQETSNNDIKNSDDKIEIVDDDFSDFEEDENDEEEEKVDDNKSFLLKSKRIRISKKTLTTKPNMIFLLNESVVGDEKVIDSLLNENEFFKTTFSKIKENELKFHFIDTNEPTTYNLFLSSLEESCKNKQTKYKDVLKNFKYVKMSEITIPYVQIKNSSKMAEKSINDRYLMYKKSNSSNNSFFISSKIKDELKKIISPFDLEIVQKCNKILSKIDAKDDPNRYTIMNELKISAEKHIKLMFSKLYDFEIDDKKKIDLILNAHFVFLKKEYFDIVKYLSRYKNFDDFYENNLDILNDRNKADFDMILEVTNKIKKGLISADDGKSQNEKFDDSIKGTTNYEIRQKEKIREQKLILEYYDDLTTEIEQDF